MTEETTQAEPVQVDSAVAETPSTSSEDIKKEDAAPKEEKSTPDPEKIKAAMQKRVDKRTWQLNEARKKNEELSRRLAELEKQTGPKEPKLEEYQSAEEYEKDRIEYEVQKRLRQKDEEQSKAQKQISEKEFAQKAIAAFEQRAAKFSEVAKDYDQVTKEARNVFAVHDSATSHAVAEALLQVESGPALFYHFGKNPDALDSLMEMTPVEAIYQLAKLEQSFASPQKETKVLAAPPSMVKGTGSSRSDAHLSGKELLKKYNV